MDIFFFVISCLAALPIFAVAAPVAQGNGTVYLAPSVQPAVYQVRGLPHIFRRVTNNKLRSNGYGTGKGLKGILGGGGSSSSSSSSNGGHKNKVNLWEPGYVVFERPGPYAPATSTTSDDCASTSSANPPGTAVVLTVSVMVATEIAPATTTSSDWWATDYSALWASSVTASAAWATRGNHWTYSEAASQDCDC
ncbi:hypothetical protein C7999DRAFT_36056 [Corynascus novoguineensis]|uniref:Uncharacterized protein n=1 Tax=Corynascus novoguineensis TaxID=1126955 RepID=A0AAN7CK99_9PEZI|nr:hypothetical protein C7999DRAFT_36056 [Corynascus novoguineensis]